MDEFVLVFEYNLIFIIRFIFYPEETLDPNVKGQNVR